MLGKAFKNRRKKDDSGSLRATMQVEANDNEFVMKKPTGRRLRGTIQNIKGKISKGNSGKNFQNEVHRGTMLPGMEAKDT